MTLNQLITRLQNLKEVYNLGDEEVVINKNDGSSDFPSLEWIGVETIRTEDDLYQPCWMKKGDRYVEINI